MNLQPFKKEKVAMIGLRNSSDRVFLVQVPNGEIVEVVGGYEKDSKSRNCTVFFANLVNYMKISTGLVDTKHVQILEEQENQIYEFLFLDIEDDVIVCNLQQAMKIDAVIEKPFICDLYQKLFPRQDGVLVVYNYHEGKGLYSSFDSDYPNKIIITYDPNSYPHFASHSN
ncbi:MAG: hypothetical protein V3575_03530 [Candidatus Absconditabacteria bacterium]